MKKPNNYETTEVREGSQQLPAGGYVCEITGVAERITKTGLDMLVVSVDIVEGEHRGYFAKRFAADTREDKNWPFAGTSYIVIEFADGKTNPNFKKFITYCEKSNNFKVDWDGEYNQFLGKRIGATFGREEYMGDKGPGFSTKLFWFNTVEQIREGISVPADRLLNGNSSSKKVQEDDGDDMPF